MKATQQASPKKQLMQLFPLLVVCAQDNAFLQCARLATSKPSTVVVASGHV